MGHRAGEDRVSLVIAGRNAEATLAACLGAVAPLLGRAALEEIIFVDDCSTDRTAAIARRFPVRVERGEGRGAAAARNVGWRFAAGSLIWFLDADCVAEPEALARLLAELADPGVAAAGGRYTHMLPDSRVATLVHEEIVARHRRMPVEVNVLASYHVVYRRAVLAEVGGFDPTCIWAHDAELAYRVRAAGYRLRFVLESRVGHFHPVRLPAYLAKQRQQGYWRVMLYHRHPARMAGDSYSGWSDFVQPPLAMLSLAVLALLAVWPVYWLPALLLGMLALAQVPMTVRIVRQSRQWRLLTYIPFGMVRAYWRGAGMIAGVGKLWITAVPRRSRATNEGRSEAGDGERSDRREPG